MGLPNVAEWAELTAMAALRGAVVSADVRLEVARVLAAVRTDTCEEMARRLDGSAAKMEAEQLGLDAEGMRGLARSVRALAADAPRPGFVIVPGS